SRRIRTLSALDPNSFIRTKWEAQLPEIEENIRKTLRRSVVRSYYKHMEDFLRKWVWGRVPDGGAIPGVIVVMREGEAVKGKLVSDDEEFVVVENQGRIIKIAKNMVSSVPDVDLNPRRRVPGYGDSKKYVEDETGGITAGIITALLEEYKEYSTPQLAIDQELIEGFWKDRLTSVVEITREGRKQTVPVCVIHEATYGIGTWLREGTPTASTGGQSRDGRRRAGGGQQAQNDPERWWLSQPREVRYQVVRAMAAEALCDVTRVFKVRCTPCGGRGGTVVMGSSGQTGRLGGTTKVCGTCRGSGYFIKLKYR
ncbi:MAG: DnaJ-like cysteine-rich domain-containing protein, partial [Planctomycetota bacterium]